MMRKIMITLTLAALLCAAAGCGGDESSTAPAATSAADATSAATDSGAGENSAAEESATPDSTAVLTAGAWYAVSDTTYSYYIFYADGTGGSCLGTDTGSGVPFTYETVDGVTTFHMGSADSNETATVTSNGTTATIAWDGGITETLTYVSSETDAFTFYDDATLCQMALTYYQTTTGEDISALETAVQSNADGTATIQLYTSLDGHNSNAAWYTVDRITGAGTDGNGEAVDLK